MSDLKDISKLIEAGIDEATSKKNMRILGEDAKKLVQRRTRLGKGVDGTRGPTKRLKKLSKSYKKQRKRLRKNGQLDKTTQPAKSNVTQTGQMLREIGVRARRGLAKILFIDSFAKQKAKWVQDAGRKFFYISNAEYKQLEKKVSKRVDNIIKKLNRRS